MKDDKTLTILLDIQKQLGTLGVALADVRSETKVQSETLKSIEEQAVKTNGRVTRLEEAHQKVLLEKATMAGEAKVKTAIWGGVGAVIVFIGQLAIKKFFE